MYLARNSSSTRLSHSLPPGFTPMLTAAPRTSTYGAGCPTICLRMCFNIRKACSLILPTSYATKGGAVRPPECLGRRRGAGPSPVPPRPSAAILAAPCGRTVLGGGRRAPVRPPHVAVAPPPSPRAAWTPPFRGGPLGRRGHSRLSHSQRLLYAPV